MILLSVDLRCNSIACRCLTPLSRGALDADRGRSAGSQGWPRKRFRLDGNPTSPALGPLGCPWQLFEYDEEQSCLVHRGFLGQNLEP